MWQSLTYYSLYIDTALCTWEYSQHNSSSSRYTKNVYFSSECMGDAGVVLVCVFVCPRLFCVQTAHHSPPPKTEIVWYLSGIRDSVLTGVYICEGIFLPSLVESIYNWVNNNISAQWRLFWTSRLFPPWEIQTTYLIKRDDKYLWKGIHFSNPIYLLCILIDVALAGCRLILRHTTLLCPNFSGNTSFNMQNILYRTSDSESRPKNRYFPSPEIYTTILSNLPICSLLILTNLVISRKNWHRWSHFMRLKIIVPGRIKRNASTSWSSSEVYYYKVSLKSNSHTIMSSTTATITATGPTTTTGTVSFLVPPADKSTVLYVSPDPSNDGLKYNYTYEQKSITVENLRGKEDSVSLDTTGFQFFNAPSTTTPETFDDEEEIKKVYYPESIEFIKKLTGASRVVIFDHSTPTLNRTQSGSSYTSLTDLYCTTTSHPSSYSRTDGHPIHSPTRTKRPCGPNHQSSRCARPPTPPRFRNSWTPQETVPNH